MSRARSQELDTEPRTMVDVLLAEQGSMTAVARFARTQTQEEGTEHAGFYRDLIPLDAPAPGEQYAFEVDLDRCSGCKACVTACHSLNGLDEEETWREVGLLYSEDWRAPFQANITTACHHCVDPGCLSGCPVLAYEKDPVTGIVHHLDDQCIGCQYCVMKCPYDVPKYSVKRGIVRKCDMCSGRLSQGEAPACVQACPSQAIRITLVHRREVSIQFRGVDGTQNPDSVPEGHDFLPTSPPPNHTIPTTRYKSVRPLPAHLLAGDHARVSPAEAHLPLVFMLVLSQLAVGVGVAAWFTGPAKWLTLVSFTFGALGLGCGALHLGQPLKAWRAFLGWRTSWFSREVIAFGAFVPLVALSAGSFWLAPLTTVQPLLMCLASVAGLVAVACSAMIYVDTRREFWRASQCFGKFFGTTLLLGSAAALAPAAVVQGFGASGNVRVLAGVVFIVTLVKLGFEHRIFRHLVEEQTPAPAPLSKTARLLEADLGAVARRRVACGVLGGLLLPGLLALKAFPVGPALGWAAAGMFAFCLLGELSERYLFFTAVAPAKMPGGLVA
jgi:formate dehydrogenase iron-sulfur subunit